MAAWVAWMGEQCSSQRYWPNNEALACCFQYPVPLSEQSLALGLLLLSATPVLAHWRNENKVWCSGADLCAFLLTPVRGLSAPAFPISEDTEAGLKNTEGFFFFFFQLKKKIKVKRKKKRKKGYDVPHICLLFLETTQ